MTITELYKQLEDKDFQDYRTGDLFFPAYMYMYDPAKEYEVENEILDIKNRLHRPNSYLDVMVLDIFEEFLEFLKQEKLGKVSKLEYYKKYEKTNPRAIDSAIKQDVYNKSKKYKEESLFLKFLNNKINQHLEQAKPYEVAYVFVKGFGNAYPYIRTSRFMSNFEKYIKGYKLIMFYPGEAKNYYSLFGLLKDENLYRAIKLINA